MKLPAYNAETETGGGEAAPDAAPVDTGPDLSFIPDDFRGENGTLDTAGFATHYSDMLAEKAARDEALGLVPEKYEFGLPESIDYGDLDLPEGFAVDLKADDPALAPLFEEFGGILKDLNAPAETASKLMGLMAKYEATQYANSTTALRQALEPLGPNDAMRQARIDRVVRAAEAKLPADQAEALIKSARDAGTIKALETLLSPKGASATHSTAPREMTDDERLNARYANSRG